jgi:hypothetical protein
MDTLKSKSWIHYEGGAWLGELIGDQQHFDKECLVLMMENIEIVAFIKVSLSNKETVH